MAGVRSIGEARIGSGYPWRGKWEKDIQGFIAVCTTIQLLTPLKGPSEAARKRRALSKIGFTAERGETVELARQAVSEGRHAYALVIIRSDGNAPLPVQALSAMFRA
jgi:hypothetical protein